MKKPRIIINKIIPFPGFLCINLFGVLFSRGELSPTDINHEMIHTEQMKELGYIGFYILYILEWAIRLFIPSTDGAYMNISFEREAYGNEDDLDYLKNRKHWSSFKYVIKSN